MFMRSFLDIFFPYFFKHVVASDTPSVFVYVSWGLPVSVEAGVYTQDGEFIIEGC